MNAKPWLLTETTPDAAGDGGTGEGADRPDFLLDRFKTPEDQARAYAEAEKEMNRLRAQADTDREQFAAALERIEADRPDPAPQQPNGLDAQTNQLLQAYQAAVESGDGAAQLSIQLALNQQATAQLLDDRLSKLTPQLDTQAQADRNIAFELANERVAKQYGDRWAEIQPEVQAWLKEHQSWLPQENSPDAFTAVIREGAQIVTNAKAAEALAAVEKDRAAKIGAQTAQGSGQGKYPTATPEKQQEWADVVAAQNVSYSDLTSRKS